MIKVEMKVCAGEKGCGLPKPLSAFTKDKRSPDGLSRYCSQCSRKLNAGYRRKNAVKNIKRYSASTLMDKVTKRLRKYAIRNDKSRRITIETFKEALLQPEWRKDTTIKTMLKELKKKHRILSWQEGDIVLIDNRGNN